MKNKRRDNPTFHDFVPRLFPERIQETKFCPSCNLTVVNRQILSVPLKLIQITDNIQIGLNCFSAKIYSDNQAIGISEYNNRNHRQ